MVAGGQERVLGGEMLARVGPAGEGLWAHLPSTPATVQPQPGFLCAGVYPFPNSPSTLCAQPSLGLSTC